MAKFITFNGTTLIHPGGLTKVDAEGMAQVGAGVSGVVGIIGEADYGQPYDPGAAADAGVAPKVWAFTDPDAMAETFKSGPLADAVDFLFNPSNDVRIPGGAQKVIALKSNLDTQSAVSAEDILTTNVSCVLTSAIYGKYANNLSATLNVNAVDTDMLDLSITDGNTSTVETFTKICGNPLLDVQYAPSDPTVAVAEITTNGLAANAHELPMASTPAGCAAGRWVQITGHNAQPELMGQVRRIQSISGGHVITLQADFLTDDGTGTVIPDAGTKFKVIREAVGPFFVNAYNSTTKVITLEGAKDNQPASYTAGSPLFWVNGTGAGHIASATSGPNYIHIISGAGAGQIRRINAAASDVNGRSTITIENGFSVPPDNTSQFVFINAVADTTSPTYVGGNAMGAGAIGVVAGSSGLATTLTLQVRPGAGEPATHGGAAIPFTGAGSGGAGYRPADWVFTLSSSLNVNALVTALNKSNAITGATKGADTTNGAWKARVGLGRALDLPTSRLDFSGRANGAFTGASGAAAAGVDCLCDFDTKGAASDGTYSSDPDRYHRFVDNLALLVDTINAQSALITAARATAAGGLGAAYGDGVPALGKTFALAGGNYVATTASSLNACFDELIKHRHNTEVALWSEDTSNFTVSYVHSLLATNAKNGAGAYDNEVDCIAAFRPATTDVTPLDTIKGYANTLNDRNVALTFQDIKRPGLNGQVNQYPPHMLACAVAGMQAGAVVGTPLTFKLVRANEILCRNTRVDTLDKTTSDDLLLNGCLFTEKIKGQGYRITRNLSTYIATDNLAYTDRHVNYELNFMAYDLRTFIVDKFIGVKATPGTVASIKSAVVSKLDYYKNGIEIIVDSQDPATGERQNAYKNIKITISGDICTIRFEIFPAVGINYVTFEIFAQLPTLSA